jgi:hypothetical protein
MTVRKITLPLPDGTTVRIDREISDADVIDLLTVNRDAWRSYAEALAAHQDTMMVELAHLRLQVRRSW